MEKTRIDLDVLLPEVPDERDECINRIINSLQYKRGIDKVHIIPEGANKKAQLCFHYDPEAISLGHEGSTVVVVFNALRLLAYNIRPAAIA